MVNTKFSQGPWTAYRLVHEDTNKPLTPEQVGEYVCNSVKKSAIESGSLDFLIVEVQKADGRADVCHVGNARAETPAFTVCDGCITAVHCLHRERCFAECTVADLADPVAAVAPQPETDSLGLSIDMLDADRLTEWANNIEAHGDVTSSWANVPRLIKRLRSVAEGLREAVTDIGVLRSQRRAAPSSPGAELVNTRCVSIDPTTGDRCELQAGHKYLMHQARISHRDPRPFVEWPNASPGAETSDLAAGIGAIWQRFIAHELTFDETKRALLELAARPSAGQDLQTWQPISSAPKDVRVLVVVDGEAEIGCLESDDGGVWTRDATGDAMRTPSLWMPLPLPPPAERPDPQS